MKQIQFTKFLAIGLMGTLMLSSCGKQAFAPSVSSDAQTAAGNMNIPPKVDIVVGVSANGTMRNIYPTLQTEMAAFASNLQAQGWDYRFVSISLAETPSASTQTVLGRVAVSKYDGTYASQGTWISPFPGASATNPGMAIDPSLFSPSIAFPNDLYAQPNNGRETGLLNQQNFFQDSTVLNKFLRPDAMLAVITISNGEDRSPGIDGAWQAAWNGSQFVDNLAGLTSFENGLKALKNGATSLIKYYDITAVNTQYCIGGTQDWSGLHYQQVARDFTQSEANTIDICTVPITNALSTIATNLTSYKLNFERNILMIGAQPNVATLAVTKYSGGQASQATVIPQDPTNGWTYIGYQTGINTIDYPIPMDQQTGYAIQLNGTAKLHGSDTANVTFTNAGTPTSH